MTGRIVNEGRDRCESDLAGGFGAALAIAHRDGAVRQAHGGDWGQHTVFLDGGQECLVQAGAVADVVAHDKVYLVEVLQAELGLSGGGAHGPSSHRWLL